MSDQELEQKWRQEFEAELVFELRARSKSGSYRHYQTEIEWQAYLAACYARHAEAEELRAENARLRESH